MNNIKQTVLVNLEEKVNQKSCSENLCEFFMNLIVRVPSYSGPHFPTFGLNTDRYSVSLRIQSKCGKIRTRITPNADTFYVELIVHINPLTPGVH